MEAKLFFELMRNRQSCRSFDYNKPVKKELIVSILEVAKLSPSACNAQPYEVFIVQGEKSKALSDAKMVSFNKFIDKCNTFLIITESNYTLPAKFGSIIKNIDFKAIDIGILTANIINAAHTLGLETCILGMFQEKKLQKLIGKKSKIRLVIALGYPTAKYEIRDKIRKPFDENIHFIE